MKLFLDNEYYFATKIRVIFAKRTETKNINKQRGYMIILADGGSTKVDWRLVDNGKEVKVIKTNGANPYFRNREDISKEIRELLVPQISEHTIREVYFYGAGCEFPTQNQIIRSAIADNIDAPVIEVGSDMLAAAKSLCGKEKGIACILGTGSNTCYYDGNEIKENLASLGYILGDEGSGAVLGRNLICYCLRDHLSEGLKEKFLSQFGISHASILDSVYKEAQPNKFLAKLSIFLIQNIEEPSIYRLVYSSFEDFFRMNIMKYDYKHNTVHLTGSIAYYYQDIIKKVASDLSISIGQISQSPMEGLIKFHSQA